MGVQITELLTRKEINLEDLQGKKIAIDAFNMLYQFLTTIRQRDGALLKDSKGRVTSHLTGLFTRTANLMQKGIQLAFVFDGKSPDLKIKEQQKRHALKVEAAQKHEIAKKERDIDEMRKQASRTAKLTTEMIEESKQLIEAMGQPIIQAPSEGEAQAAKMVKKGELWAVASQDTDCLMFEAPRLIRNLSITGRRKKTNTLTYQVIKPELVELSTVLNDLGMDQEKLIILSILVGTDFNPGGIKGIGPKKALQLVNKHKDFDELFREAGWKNETKWQDIYYLIKKMPTTDNYELEWKAPNAEKIKELLVEEHDFNKERVEKTLSKITKEKEAQKQKGLGEYF